MRSSKNERFKQGSLALCLGFALTLGATPSAFADGPWLSGPSTITLGEKGVLSGGAFTPRAILTVQVTDSQGNTYAQSAQAGPDGALSYAITPTVGGFHTVIVKDSGGNPLAKTGFSAP